MEIHELLAKLRKAKTSGTGTWQALCPAHDDKQASLSVAVGEKQPIVLKCHAGCTQEEICASLDITIADLCEERVVVPPTRQRKATVVATYDYQDEQGNLLYQAVRLEPKTFKQRIPDGSGGWKWGLGNTKRVLFRLPEILKAIDDNATVILVEGEKDALNVVNRLGFQATTSPMGAGKWQSSYTESLAGAKVLIIPDNDEPGRLHAHAVAAAIHETAKSVKIINLPGLPPKGDISDWIGDDSAGKRDELINIVKKTSGWKPDSVVPEIIRLSQNELTDTGNARRLIKQYEGEMLFNAGTGKWVIWNGEYWVPDEDGEVMRRSQNVIEAMESLLPRVPREQQEMLLRHVRKSLQSGSLKAMISLAENEPGVSRPATDWNSSPYQLCVSNGIINLQSGELTPFDPAAMFSRQVQVHFDPAAVAPNWCGFLERVQPSEEVRMFLQRAVGYTLTADVSERCLFFCLGGGRNGKSTFVETICRLLGDFYAKTGADTIMVKKGGGISNDVAALAGRRMVSASELSSYKRLDDALVKDLTGGDEVTARFLNREFFTFDVRFKMWLYGNERPKISGTDDGIWSRIRLIPWEVQIPKDKVDKHLKERLQIELPGILAWAVRGCIDWQNQGLGEPTAVNEASAEYREDQDPLSEFTDSECVCGPECKVGKTELWNVYKSWLLLTGNESYYESQKYFSDAIGRRSNVKAWKGTGGARQWKGIGLVSAYPIDTSSAEKLLDDEWNRL